MLGFGASGGGPLGSDEYLGGVLLEALRCSSQRIFQQSKGQVRWNTHARLGYLLYLYAGLWSPQGQHIKVMQPQYEKMILLYPACWCMPWYEQLQAQRRGLLAGTTVSSGDHDSRAYPGRSLTGIGWVRGKRNLD